MISKPLNKIELKDIQALCEIPRLEDRTIEYKSELPAKIESDKITKLLKPVCSFANTDGGDLIFGVKDENGTPTEIIGVPSTNLDQQRLTLEQMIQAGIDPQVRGIETFGLEFSAGRFLFIVRIQRSWISPHRVKSNRSFYARNSAGCFELDVPQIRQAFTLSETVAQRIRDFRAERIASIYSQNTPVALLDGVRTVLHLAPLSSFASNDIIPVKKYRTLPPRLEQNLGSYDYHLNFDGMVVASAPTKPGSFAYTQFYRSGIIEYVRVYAPDDQLTIPSSLHERELLNNFRSGMDVLKDLGLQPPVYVFLTIIGAKGYCLATTQSERMYDGGARPFDRDVLPVQEIEVNSFDENEIATMKPLFDTVWNAADRPASLNFDENNQWRNRR